MILASSSRLGLLAAFAAAFLGQSAGAETYRWQDENGVTHYSDQVPPEAAKQRRTRLSPQGRELGVIEAAKTAEQLRREQQLKQLRIQQDKVLAEQRDRDLALLRTYRSPDEIYKALQEKLDMLDNTSKIVEMNRQRQKEFLTGQEQRAADLERQGKPVPQSLRDLIQATQRQVASYDAKLRELQTEKTSISERFLKDAARFKAITTQAQQQNPREHSGLNLSIVADKTGKDEIIISAIACGAGAVCDRAWELAREYILKHSGTPLSVETEKILQTPAPATDQDFAMTVTRFAAKSEEILFLDVRCRPSSIGEEVCSGPRVKEVRANFRAYIEAGLGASSSGSPPAVQGAR
jgi:hypothetical protein